MPVEGVLTGVDALYVAAMGGLERSEGVEANRHELPVAVHVHGTDGVTPATFDKLVNSPRRACRAPIAADRQAEVVDTKAKQL
ncbi:hypothetical protein ADK74_28720 [Streptomyces decoyicus]|nr:hypothetical protein ADK74_28720 [Streptomyces decoyicus]